MGTPLFRFRSDLNDVINSMSRSVDAIRIALKLVLFFLSLVKAGIDPLAICTKPEDKQDRVKRS
jgi:hypothetical protein